jgi:cell division protein ZipA
MDIDYLLIILPSIFFLGICGLILVIWQYGSFRLSKEKKEIPEIEAKQTNTLFLEKLIILYLLAPEGRPYQGYELVQTLSSHGFHYGEMNIFHYPGEQDKTKEGLFSLASAIEPGTFDLTHIGAILTPGLCLFMPFRDNKNIRSTFELMLETAQLLMQDLGGTLCDGQRQPLTSCLLSHYRSQLHQYA